ncbi:VWA domain-containing protein [Hymenobacter busanensis]|uniref:VWA domain-containing protein n=1 Tax=Hymenobacter busanensis TaxID=2607656 RepID=A0A7L4ZU64_9BACT|nr:VWA domain-containing protein [Hymenobacter busanensis]KAA9339547.1 VWA domain-containing protein [Hymenobacter busanensis]QHJ06698.1 VWA domain-containing protein [Hymenobacter busanensis]
MLTWLNQWTFWETMLLGIGAVLYIGYALRTRRLARPLGQSGGRIGWKFLLRAAALALLGVALLGPAYGVMPQPVRTTGKDLWLLVDLSRSMDAPDVAPTRLVRVRAELAKLVERFPADRMGLIVFSSEAYVHCPLTYDQNALLTLLGTLQTRLVPVGATDLAAPLQLALTRLATVAQPVSGSSQRATALVVVSDGEDFGNQIEGPVREMVRRGVRLYAVGVGTAEGSKLPQASGFVRDAQGRPAVTRLQAPVLRRLAELTGGVYIEVSEKRNEFPALVRALARLEGQTQQVRTVTVADNRYAYPLAAALLLLALDIIFTIKVVRP